MGCLLVQRKVPAAALKVPGLRAKFKVYLGIDGLHDAWFLNMLRSTARRMYELFHSGGLNHSRS